RSPPRASPSAARRAPPRPRGGRFAHRSVRSGACGRPHGVHQERVIRASGRREAPREVRMLTLYQFEISPFCDKIRRVLNVKRVPYQTREVGLLEAQLGFKKVNPAGKVPALVTDDGRTVCDSTDIAYWIEEHHPEPPLVPRDPRERALMHV